MIDVETQPAALKGQSIPMRRVPLEITYRRINVRWAKTAQDGMEGLGQDLHTHKPLRMGFWRIVQLMTGFHRIHHIAYSYGYKLPFLPFGWFSRYRRWSNEPRPWLTSLQRLRDGKITATLYGPMYHNCTLTGR